jgi:hypothetical protein
MSSRRHFLLQAGLAGGLSALAGSDALPAAEPSCEVQPPPNNDTEKRGPSYDFPPRKTRIRKEVHDLSDDEVKRLALAYKKLNALDGKDNRSWCQQANVHDKHCSYGPGDRPPGKDAYWMQVHMGWYFLPWHRAFLYFYESILAQLIEDDTFALPYWDWSKNPTLPEHFFINDTKDPRYPLYHSARRVKSSKDSIEKDAAVRNSTSPDMLDCGPTGCRCPTTPTRPAERGSIAGSTSTSRRMATW